MSKLAYLSCVVEKVLANQIDKYLSRMGSRHLFGVAYLCSLLADKRELDADLAASAGILHDIYKYRTGLEKYHDYNSEEEARVILRDSQCFTEHEQKLVRNAILHHLDTKSIYEPYDELLKDANVLEHYLHDNKVPFSKSDATRIITTALELGLTAQPVVREDVAVETPTAPCDKRDRLAQIAEDLAGQNLRGNENKSGPDVYPMIRYFPGSTSEKGFDWCASFVYHCCMLAGFTLPIKHPKASGRFAGVKAWLDWSQLDENNFYYPATDSLFIPSRGDLVIFDNIVGYGPHDHIGIVLNCEETTLTTAEGNVENRSGVFVRSRNHNINGFVRIPNNYQYK